MKKIILLLLLGFSLNLYSNYEIYIDDKNSCFELHIISTDVMAYCSYLKPSFIYIEDFDGEKGKIFIDLDNDFNIEPLDEIGHSQACIEFSKGICLPKVNIGEYDFFINNEFLGRIFVERDEVYFASYVNY